MSTDHARESEFFYVLQDKIRILLVDDDLILCEFAIVHLSSEAAAVRTAATGEQALDIIAGEPVDLMLLDLEMPGMNGFEVLERVRADAKTAHLPVIVVTGHEDVRAIDRAYEAGATSFVVKPINWRQLAYQIRYVHRAALAEAERAGARPPAVDEAMRALAKQSAAFMRDVLEAAPQLRPGVERQAALLARALAARPRLAGAR
jgi:DNA-binding response OmpR family regulator